MFTFYRMSYHRVYFGSGCGGSVYSMVYLFARRRTRTPGKNKTIIAILQSYPESHSEYYAPLKTFLLYSVPFRPPPLLYLPRGSGKLSSATVKQSDQANSINPEHLFFMIVDNLVVLLLCSCLF